MDRVKEILEEIGQLSLQEQKRLLAALARKLQASGRGGTAKKGTPASEFLSLAGSISREDMEAIERAVEEDCERIDPEEWQEPGKNFPKPLAPR